MSQPPTGANPLPSPEAPTMPGTPANQPAPKSRRRRWWIIGAVVVVLVAGGLTWWLWPSAANSVPGTVQATMLSADDASRALGQTLQSQHGLSAPPPALAATPGNCAVAVGPATQAVYTPGWTTFGSLTYQDSDTVADHTVTQVLGQYGDASQAQQVFGALSAGVKGCPSAVRAGASGGQAASKWTYAVSRDTADTLVWKSTQDAGGGWACYREARLKGRTVVQVAICEAGDGSQAVATIANQLVGRVSG